MSNIVEHVTSKELSERLMDLGVKQEGLYVWWVYDDGTESIVGSHESFDKKLIKTRLSYAFLSSELGEMLPGKIQEKDGMGSYKLSIEKGDDIWKVEYIYSYYSGINTDYLYSFSREKKILSEAMGLILEYLIKNKLITLF